VVVPALLGVFGVPLDSLDGALSAITVGIGNSVLLWGENDGVVVLEVDDLVGELEEGRDVADEVIGRVADANDQRRTVAGRLNVGSSSIITAMA
jgi:hypothetical protein